MSVSKPKSALKEALIEILSISCGMSKEDIFEIIIDYSSNIVVVATKSFAIKHLIGDKYKATILKKLKHSHPEVIDIVVDIQETLSPNSDKMEFIASNMLDISNELITKYTFEQFVTGVSNNIAFSSAKRLALGDPNVSSMLIYGNTGLGKTHIMHALGHEFIAHNKNAKVLLLTTHHFQTIYVESSRNGKLPELQKDIANADLILFDDIHNLKEKSSTLKEFERLISDIISNQKALVVMTSVKTISDIDIYSDRFKSIIQQGFTPCIENSSYELRVEILQSKLKHFHKSLRLEDDVIPFNFALLFNNNSTCSLCTFRSLNCSG